MREIDNGELTEIHVRSVIQSTVCIIIVPYTYNLTSILDQNSESLYILFFIGARFILTPPSPHLRIITPTSIHRQSYHQL